MPTGDGGDEDDAVAAAVAEYSADPISATGAIMSSGVVVSGLDTDFSKELEVRRSRVQRGVAERPTLSCLSIAEETLAPLEAASACSFDLTDLAALDDAASDASAAGSTSRRPRGRGHRERRAATRALRLQ